MLLQEIEEAFYRSWSCVLSKNKICASFFILFLCSCLVMAYQIFSLFLYSWMLSYVALFFISVCVALLFFLGIVLSRMHGCDRNRIEINFRRSCSAFSEVAFLIIYLITPIFFFCVLCRILLGSFWLLTEIPIIGPFAEVICGFIPFVLIFYIFCMGIFILVSLFYVTPHIALKTENKIDLPREMWMRWKCHLFVNILFFIISISPFLCFSAILLYAFFVTETIYLSPHAFFAFVLQKFFIMIPFALFLTPCIIFFFHFSTESLLLWRKGERMESHM